MAWSIHPRSVAIGLIAGAGAALLLAQAHASRDVTVRRLTAREIRIIDETGTPVVTILGENGVGLVRVTGEGGESLRPSLEPDDRPDVAATPGEAPTTDPPNAPSETPAPGVAALWRQPHVWSQLRVNIPEDAVRQLLGEPRLIRKTSSGSTWIYGEGDNGEGRV